VPRALLHFFDGVLLLGQTTLEDRHLALQIGHRDRHVGAVALHDGGGLLDHALKLLDALLRLGFGLLELLELRCLRSLELLYARRVAIDVVAHLFALGRDAETPAEREQKTTKDEEPRRAIHGASAV
jgi:hypothetical protein